MKTLYLFISLFTFKNYQCSLDQQRSQKYLHVYIELFIRFTASAFRKLPSIYVFSYFPFGFEGRMWDLIVSVPDHCLSFYFTNFKFLTKNAKKEIN